MTVGDLLTTLEREGAELWEESGRLRFRAPKGVMTEERKQVLREGRHAALEILRNRGALPQLETRPAQRYDPFPLTDVQAAYVLGRSEAFAYGGVACHGYAEFEVPDLDPGRLQAAWRSLIARHDMLRAVIDPSGSQQVLASVPDFVVEVLDLHDARPDETEAAIGAVRDQMSHRVYEPGVWPMFDLRVSRSASGTRLHLSIDFLICDLVSTQVLLAELLALYEAPDRALPALEISFRDYRLAEEALLSSARAEADRAWWLGRLDELPPPPELPVLQGAAAPPHFSRLQARLHADEWARLRQRAGDEGVTASVAVLAAFAEVVGRWSRRPAFTLDLTLQNRLPLHPQVARLVGDFTAVGLLAVDQDLQAPLRERARALQTRLWEDLDHRLFSGVRVAREVARRRGQGAGLFPVVFTSAIGATGPGPGPAGPGVGMALGDVVDGITQTPQVWIDCQALESGGGLTVNWDVRDGVFPDGVVPDMFESFERLLGAMAGDEVWTSIEPVVLPPAQRERRRRVNATAGPLPDAGLHESVVRQCREAPERLAVVSGDRRLSYGELLARAAAVAEALAADGCEPGEIVAVVMEKGWEQVAAVLGILLAGAAYLPVDSVQPAARRDAILANAGARRALTQSWLPEAPELRRIAVDALAPADGWGEVPPRRRMKADPDALAYVIYTSGSTGVPKGVMITHRAALNTVEDINRRFGVGPQDRVLGLSNLGFDLSVYDIFGLLSAGGTLVLPEHGRRADPSHWTALAAEHRVSIWNSVPAQLQMLADYLSTAGRSAAGGAGVSSLRLALVSGDWIPVHLPDHVRELVPGLEFVSLGGATEAAIWSIAYPVGDVPAGWTSIPYGKPLTNQSFHVLDPALRPCPDWVAGDLYIGGAGLALGYLGDRDKTEAAFIRHPGGGERLYRTGDLGRHLPDGNIEFLGREDRQVKIRGHRIELAEVESALVTHPAVSAGVVVIDGDGPAERRLAGFVETARRSDPERWSTEATRRLAAAATAACAAVTSGVDRDRYAAYSRRVDEAALQSMLDALRQVGALDASRPVGGLIRRLEARLGAEMPGEIAPEHRRLVRRWLRALSAAGLLEPGSSAVGLAGSGRPVELEALWADAASLAEGVEEPGLVKYFRSNARRLPALLRGAEDPLGLL
ncbi:MAG TPA: amino acid adenylation domain-containing protein, partial [Actinomycetota bacterium]